MKKIFILILATLIFASCEPTTGSTVVVPVRDQVETIPPITGFSETFYGTSYNTVDAFEAILEKALSETGYELEASPSSKDGVFRIYNGADSGVIEIEDVGYVFKEILESKKYVYITRFVEDTTNITDKLIVYWLDGETLKYETAQHSSRSGIKGIKPKDPTN